MHMLFKIMFCVLMSLPQIKASEPPENSLDLKNHCLLAFPRTTQYYDVGSINLTKDWTDTTLLATPFTFEDRGRTASAFVQDGTIKVVRTDDVGQNSISIINQDGIHTGEDNVHAGENAAFSYAPDIGILCTGGNTHGRTTGTTNLITVNGDVLLMPHMIEGRENHHCIFDHERRQWIVFGGYHTDYNVQTVQAFDPRESQWRTVELTEDAQKILSYFGGSVVHAHDQKYILTGGFSQEDGNKPLHTIKIRTEQYLFDLSDFSIQQLPHQCFHINQRCDGISLGKYYGVYSWRESEKLQIFDKNTGEYMSFGWVDLSYNYNALLLDITGTALDAALNPSTAEAPLYEEPPV